MSWEEWWEAFPSAIADLPGLGNGPLADKLAALLANGEPRGPRGASRKQERGLQGGRLEW